MRSTTPIWLLPLLALVFYLASSVDGYLYEAFGIPPLYGQLITMGYLGAHLTITALIFGTQRFHLAPGAITAIQLIFLYLFWTTITFAYSPQNEIVVDILINRVRTALFLTLLIFAFSDLRARVGFSYTSILLVALGAALVVFDFFQPTFSTVPGRGAGFYLNPNDAGLALVLFGLCAASIKNTLLHYILWGVAAFGCLLTFSRSAWILLIMAVIALTAMGRLGGGRARFVFLGGILTVFSVVLATYISGDLYSLVARSPLGEYLDPNTLARLGARGVAFDDYSAIEREAVFQLGLEKFFDSPFIGHGVGYTHVWEESVSTHNMLTLLGAELGIVGIALYLAIFATLLTKGDGVGRVIATIMLVSGLATHNQFDDPALIIPLAFAISNIPSRRAAPASSYLIRQSSLPKLERYSRTPSQ